MTLEARITALAQSIGADVKALRGASLQNATLIVADVANGYAEIVILVPGVGTTSKVMAQYAPQVDAENDVEELIDNRMQLWCIPEPGQIRFCLSANAPFTGSFRITYEVTL